MHDDAPRRLVLLRHAEAGPGTTGDHDRELTDRGREQARGVAQWLADAAVTPDLALVSDSVRTVTTARLVRGAARWPVRATRALYEVGPEALLDELRNTVPGEVHTLLVVGHNPTLAQLVMLLDDGTGTDAGQVLQHGFEPSSAAVLEVDGTWQSLRFGAARLASLRSPGHEH